MHGRYLSDQDHTPDPTPLLDDRDARLICDFCGVHHPTWDFPCRTFEFLDAARNARMVVEPSVETLDFDSGGDWTACDDCAQLILQDRYEELSRRALKQHTEADPALGASPAARREILRRLTMLHQAFRANRLGPAVEIEQAHWIATELSTIFHLGE